MVYLCKKGSDTMAKKNTANRGDERLLTIIKNDTKLEDDIRMEYLTLGNTFLDDFRTNITLTSIELDDKYGYGIDTWNGFINYPMIKKYIQGFVKELISKSADANLIKGEGVRDSINVRKEMDKANGDLQSERFVIFLLPKKIVEDEALG
jgi:hypothetical protein